jgi:hypothetical protein
LTLIDDWLPDFDHTEFHETLVSADAHSTYAAIADADLARSPVVRALFALRGIIGGHRRDISSLERAGFLRLDERPGEELLLGLVGAFWRPTGKLQRLSADGFRAYERSGFAKAAWNFRVETIDAATTRLTTETRVRCCDAKSRRSFGRYWRFVGPFSGLIRTRMLATIKRDAERR